MAKRHRISAKRHGFFGFLFAPIITDQEMAWAAGIVDGEGCISMYRERKPYKDGTDRYSVRVAVKMTHRQTVARLATFFPYASTCWGYPDNERHRKYYIATWTGRAAIFVLMSLQQHLYTKRLDAEFVLKFHELRKQPRTPHVLEQLYRCYAACRHVKRNPVDWPPMPEEKEPSFFPLGEPGAGHSPTQ